MSVCPYRYALLQFVSAEEAAAAFKTLNKFEIDGKELSVQESTGVSSRPPRLVEFVHVFPFDRHAISNL